MLQKCWISEFHYYQKWKVQWNVISTSRFWSLEVIECFLSCFHVPIWCRSIAGSWVDDRAMKFLWSKEAREMEAGLKWWSLNWRLSGLTHKAAHLELAGRGAVIPGISTFKSAKRRNGVSALAVFSYSWRRRRWSSFGVDRPRGCCSRPACSQENCSGLCTLWWGSVQQEYCYSSTSGPLFVPTNEK